MYKAKKVIILLAVLVFSTSSLFAQLGAVSADAAVNISVKPALTISNLDGPLNFSDVLFGESVDPVITPNDGVRFQVQGHNTGAVVVTYGNTTLWDISNTNSLTFTPDVATTLGNSNWGSGGTPVGNSSPVSMTDNSGVGEAYLWLGGKITIAGAPVGDYTGTFTLTVAYN